LFLDRKSMGGGVLKESVAEGLRESRWLIVCCSANARESRWVDHEVAEFLKTHTDRDVLVCDVGPADETVLPRSVEELQSRRGELRRPDLKGFPEQKSRREQQPAVEEALSLLADIMGFGGKDLLLDSVARGRARLWRAVVATAVVAIIGLTGGWIWLYHTLDGTLFRAERSIVRTASVEVIDEPYLASTSRAFGLLGRRSSIEKIAVAVKDSAFRGLVVAAGLVSLPKPDCAGARALLERVDRGSASVEPRAFLLVQKYCSGNSTDLVRPDPLNKDNVERWGRMLAQTGLTTAAEEILAREDFPPASRLPLRVAISVGAGTPLTLSREEIAAWSGQHDSLTQVHDALREIHRLDRGGRLKDSGALLLLDHARVAFDRLSSRNWNRQQQLAAHLAANDRAAAAELLGDRPAWTFGALTYATGLAWRALALHRLGRPAEGETCFADAAAAARIVTPQTRTWSEWTDIAEAAALANDWRRAFHVAREPGNELARFRLQCHVFELWASRTHVKGAVWF
jgi:hypothetical protein